jgi:hypothetical protein
MIRLTLLVMGYTLLAYVMCDPLAPLNAIVDNISDPGALFVIVLIAIGYLIIPLIVAYGVVAIFLGRYTPCFWLPASACILLSTLSGSCG